MRWLVPEKKDNYGNTIESSYMECDHNCKTCKTKCDMSKMCKNCGEYYDTDEHSYCPYCGYDPFVDT